MHSARESSAKRPIRNLRYVVLALLLFSTLINYIDRQTLSVLKNELSSKFSWSETDYSHILIAFQVAYAAMQLGSGWVMDVLGTRVGFALTMVFWSLAAMAHSLARGLFGFGVCRFLLGAGEAGNWPGSVRATSEWFPPHERAFATGVWNTGSATGAVIAPPLVAWIFTHWGWQHAFLVTGSLGFVWLVLWLRIYRPPGTHPRIGADERRLLALAGSSPGAKARMRDLFRDRQAWGLALARFVSDPVWWFYLFWLPGYLGRARGFTLMEIGQTAWIPYLSADLGSLAGGAASSLLIRRGMDVLRARKLVMVSSASLMILAPFAARAQSPAAMLALISVATFAHQSWASGILTLPADLFSGGAVASCSGFTGMWASIGGLLATAVIGPVVDHHGYTPVFTWAGLMHPLAAVLIVVIVRGRPGSSAAPASVAPGGSRPTA